MVITAAERAAMQNTQESHMGDTCVVQSAGTPVQDEYGQESTAYPDGEPVPCGFSYTSSVVAPERQLPNSTVLTIDATVRLRVKDGENVSPTGKVKLTHRFGEALSTPQVYEIVSNPQVGPSGVVLQLQRVTL